MKNCIGALEQPRGTQREQVCRTGPCADEVDRAAHSIIPAATVWFVVSSIRMKAPVARLAA